jgi:hypothetical protein
MKKSAPWTVLVAGCGAVTLVVGIIAQDRHMLRVSRTIVATAPMPIREPASILRPEHLASVRERTSLAFAIIERVAQEAKARGLQPGWRQSMLEALLPLGEHRLRRVEQEARTLQLLSAAIAASADEPATLGDGMSDFTFTPVTPCRYVDTRNAAGKISGVRTYRIDQTGAPYGGSGACDLVTRFGMAVTHPLPLAALAMNVTVVDTSSAGAPGFLAVKPSTSAPTTSLLNWYDAGVGVQVANQAVVAVDQFSGGGSHFAIETSGAVHVIVDIFGGFIAPQATAIQTTHVSTPLIPVNVNDDSDIATPSCPSGYSLIGGGCFTDNVSHYLLRSAPFGQAWSCASQNSAPSPSFVRATAVCGRIPGR